MKSVQNGTEKTPYLDTFHAVNILNKHSQNKHLFKEFFFSFIFTQIVDFSFAKIWNVEIFGKSFSVLNNGAWSVL